MDNGFDYRNDEKFLADKEEKKQYLLNRLKNIWFEQMTELSDYDRIRLYGNANELELCLMYMFNVSSKEIDEIRASELAIALKFQNKNIKE